MMRERTGGRKKTKGNEAVEAADGELEVYRRSQSSVEVKRDSKGALSYTVKVYRDEPGEAAKMATDLSRKMDKELKLT